MGRVAKFYESQQTNLKPNNISGEEANRLIGNPLSLEASDNTSVAHLFGIGKLVSVTPDDTGKIPTKGILVAVDHQKILIDVTRKDGSVPSRSCRVCFPRLGFVITPEANGAASRI